MLDIDRYHNTTLHVSLLEGKARLFPLVNLFDVISDTVLFKLKLG